MQSRKESGFSLIEVMITSFILAVGLLGIVALQGIAKKSLADTDKQIEASYLARTALQELRTNTAWIKPSSSSSDTQDVILTRILTNVASSAKRSNMNLCRNVTDTYTVRIAVSWQVQGADAAKQSKNCGKRVTNRRQVMLASFIKGAI
ncbi:prepilin-type N-terminal cleavage/methylation domain-containing protein [Moritella sp. 5]|uniref:type IV pilus modification PilV family protein n=1 Tax=Moritella sp. 5 TaxID=2746231 RepID=UPI001BA4827C|nr:prepilin-type N-terminal cleavage/methylation domain-containing protein [Moritella sp. 5]QUM82346.1 prepilin-type N-terminal cleavage/methylation domain-containing protein [Moritella sp. 5]